MDDIQNTLRTIVTVLAFAVFIGIVVWAWSGKRRDRFSEAARIPFEEDGVHNKTESRDSSNTKRTDTKRTDTKRTDAERSGT